MIPLIIDDKKLKSLRLFAEMNRVTLHEMQQIIQNKVPPVGDREGYVCNLDYGFKLVFSIEEHPKKDGGTAWCRHMSVSLTESTGTRVPSIIAVQLLCQSLGFKPLEQCYVQFVDNNHPRYVEVVSLGVRRTDAGWLGNGIYFGNAICTSAAYAHPGKRQTRFITVANVALGKIKEYRKITYGLNKPPDGFNSCHGVRGSEFSDDEFVVYDQTQQRLEYLVEVSG